MKAHSLIDPSKVTTVAVAAGSNFDLEFNATSTDQTLRFVDLVLQTLG